MDICLHTTNQVSQNYIGGTERFLIKVAKELKILGWNPFIVCSSNIEQSYVEGIKVIGRLPSPFFKNIHKYKVFNSSFLKNEVVGYVDNANEVARKVSDYTMMQLDGINADVYHLNSFLSASYVEGVLTNTITTNHQNNLEIDSVWGKGFFDDYSNLIQLKGTNLHKLKGLYVPSKFYAEFFSQKFNLKVENIKLGVDISCFSPVLHNDNNTINAEEFIVLLPSRLKIGQKGHDLALKACKMLKNKKIKFKLVISGIGTSTKEDIVNFRNMIKDYGIEDSVTLTSYGDMMNAYKSCDVVISPERFCSYGLSISESLSLGINTILSDIPTYKEIAKGYEHALFFREGDHEELYQKLHELSLRKKQLVNKLEMIRFRNENDIRDCAKSYSKIYTKMLKY